jgi:hypothetical protein
MEIVTRRCQMRRRYLYEFKGGFVQVDKDENKTEGRIIYDDRRPAEYVTDKEVIEKAVREGQEVPAPQDIEWHLNAKEPVKRVGLRRIIKKEGK